MKTYLPLKSAIQEDDFTVGFKAAIISHLEKEFNIPFSIILTSDVFFEFISYNTLGESIRNLIETPLDPQEQSRAFVKLSKDFESASFPSNILSSLREAFELLTLDANNIQQISSGQKEDGILSLRRSLNYEDQDEVFSGTLLTRTNFESFLKTIKSLYLSAFLPSSISHRNKKNIKDFSIAILVSNLPDIRTCIEVSFEEDENKMLVESYTGFLDFSNKIPRDKFEVAIDFLKITNRHIERQRQVSVFDMESNRTITKQYVNLNPSSQSIEEPKVIEIARLTKKIQHALQYERLKIYFVNDKHGNLYLLDVHIMPRKVETQQTLDDSSKKSEDSSGGTDLIENNQRVEKSQSSEINDVIDPDLEEEFIRERDLFEKEYYSEGSKEQREKLSKMIVEFLSHYQNSPFKTEVHILMNALVHNSSQGMILHGLSLCRDIVRSWKE
jgi:phosphoenolpyruvate synthase/pyruvate phosphate dikinase